MTSYFYNQSYSPTNAHNKDISYGSLRKIYKFRHRLSILRNLPIQRSRGKKIRTYVVQCLGLGYLRLFSSPPSPIATTCPLWTSWSRLWPKCNRLLRLGRPWGAVTLSRWGGWWYMNMKYQEGALNISSTKLPRPWSPWKSFPSRKRNRNRDLVINSQKLWPTDHEAGHT
jgi:hypothetical protein